MYEIQKGVPIPEVVARTKSGKPPTYPFADMEVGDAFFVMLAKIGTKQKNQLGSIRSAASRAKRRPGASGSKFLIQIIESDSKLGIWRVA